MGKNTPTNKIEGIGERLLKLMEGKYKGARDLARDMIGTVLPDESKERRYPDKSPFEKKVDTVRSAIEKCISQDILSPSYISLICKFFGCSADYLFGIITEPTHEIKTASEITGLDTKTVDVLIKINDQVKDFGKNNAFDINLYVPLTIDYLVDDQVLLKQIYDFLGESNIFDITLLEKAKC